MARPLQILLFLCTIAFSSCVDDEYSGSGSDYEHKLHLLFMTSSSGRFNSSGTEFSVRLALDRINRNTSLLSGYFLELIGVKHTTCHRTTSVREFLTQVQLSSSPALIGVIGCGCSVATEPVADIISLYGLPLISYTPVGMSGSSGHYQMFPSDKNFVQAVLSLVREFKWRQLSILTQNEEPFIQMEQQLVQVLFDNNVTVLSSNRFGSHQDPALFNGSVFVKEARVFIVNSYEDRAKQLFCVFKDNKIEDARYAWILYGWYSKEWWKSASDVNCSENELTALLERALVIQQYPVAQNMSNNTNLGRSESLQGTSSRPFVDTLAYDSVWTLALALNRTVNMINTNDTLNCGSSLAPLEEFSYGNSSTACLIRRSLSETNFTGLSGYVSFTKEGIRKQPNARVLQYRNVSSKLSLELIATVVLEELRYSYLKGENICTVWLEDENGNCPPPPDGLPKEVVSNFQLISVIVLYSMGAVGIVMTTICLLFNFIFRKRKVIRLTSPNLNYFILLGSYLLFTSPFTGMPYYTQNIYLWTCTCFIRTFTDCLGYALVFGTILAKLWRIYFIFHDPFRKKKRKVSDCRMALIIFAIVGIVAVMLVVGAIIPDTRPSAYTSIDLERQPELENGIPQNYLVIDCLSRAASYWVLVLFAYLGLLQISSFILALLNRKVTIKVLNDSNEITLIVYITSFAALEMLVLYFVVGDFNNANASLYTGHLLAATMVTLLIIYIPKMISLYKDPKGENIFDKSVTTTLQNTKPDSGYLCNSMDRKLSICQGRPLVIGSSSNSTESSMCTSPGTSTGSYMVASTNPIVFGAISEEDDHTTTKLSSNEHALIPTENNN